MSIEETSEKPSGAPAPPAASRAAAVREGAARALAALNDAGKAAAEMLAAVLAIAAETLIALTVVAAAGARALWSKRPRLAARGRALATPRFARLLRMQSGTAPKAAPPPVASPAPPPLVAPPVAGAASPTPVLDRLAAEDRRRAAEKKAPRAEPPVTEKAATDASLAAVAPATPVAAKAQASAPAPARLRLLIVEALSTAGSLAFAGLAAALFVAFVVLAPRVPESADLWAVNRQSSVVILDMTGAELAARGARYGERVTVGELPDYLVQAFIATEDRRFYSHRGVDFRGAMRALMTNLREREVVEGGSTITQQLARNLFLSPEQTFIRKAREALLALWIEGRYTKEEVLSLYLNRIYLGAGAYGVEAAAQTYFSKSAREVSLSEAVMLAGLPKAPSQLAPTQNPLGAQARADEVLGNLVETGAVTEFEAREALKARPTVTTNEGEAAVGYFFDYIAAKARGMAGGATGDLIVTTTLDRRLQRAAQAAIASVISTETKLAGAEQAALIAYDVNGALRAMVGGVSYVDSQFNRATQAKRQPGSAFKPFVYVAALEAGLSPQSSFVDEPIKVENWEPKNYANVYEGRMRLTDAVAKSVNTIAVQASEYAGREKVVEVAHRLGVASDIPALPSIALGGLNLTLEELVGAYIPFARGGTRVAPYAIERIENQNLEVIYQRSESRPEAVLAPDVARDMTHLLYQVMHSGTGASAALGERVSAGKTGTTNDWRDAWFVGYTAQIVAGVWVGNDAYTPMDRVTGGTLPAQIWKNFMLAAHRGLPLKPLEGAYPASAFANESALLSFYADAARDLRDVRRDGRERRGRRGWRDN